MIFSHIAPRPALRSFVRDYLIAHFRFDHEKPAPLKPYAPKPEQGITFFVRGRPNSVNPLTGELQTAPNVSIFGQQQRRCDVHLASEFLMLRVHFQPGALFRLLNVPLYEYGENYFDAELVLNGEARDVSERLSTAQSYDEMVAFIEEYLVRRVGKAKQDVHSTDRAASCLTADPRNASLDWLARQACLSPRQFNRKFTERMGVGPKLYSRVVRFHRAHRLKASHRTIAWPTVAIECGYADYQHMVRDFRYFTNATPNVWLDEDSTSPERVLTGASTGQLSPSRA
jgi:AraC-like DNA-binding protein